MAYFWGENADVSRNQEEPNEIYTYSEFPLGKV